MKVLDACAFSVPGNLFAYIVCAAVKSTGRVVFFAARREKATGRYLQRASRPVVCRRFSTHFARDGAP